VYCSGRKARYAGVVVEDLHFHPVERGVAPVRGPDQDARIPRRPGPIFELEDEVAKRPVRAQPPLAVATSDEQPPFDPPVAGLAPDRGPARERMPIEKRPELRIVRGEAGREGQDNDGNESKN
jgi:hypothetical protein